jgi:hypothetical protein
VSSAQDSETLPLFEIACVLVRFGPPISGQFIAIWLGFGKVRGLPRNFFCHAREHFPKERVKAKDKK